MSAEEAYVARPFRLIALFCAFLALCLDAVALWSPSWVTAESFSLSLWESCRRAASAWRCTSTLRSDWQVAALVLLLAASAMTLSAFIVALISLCRGTRRKCCRTAAIFLFTAVVLQACALVLYPIKFIDGSVLQTYHEFNWGYGVAWGATVFMLGGGVLFCVRLGAYEAPLY